MAFKLAVAAAVTTQFSASEAVQSLLTVSIGGLATGSVVALVANVLRRSLRSDTPDSVRVDTILSLLIPYAAYLASEKLAVSGVLSVVAAGLCGGVLDRKHLRASTRLNGVALWSTVTLTLFALRMGWTLPMAWWSNRSGTFGDVNLSSFKMLFLTVMCGVRGSLALSATLSIHS